MGAVGRQQQRALTEVVQQQRRPDEPEPREPHGPLAEVAHVGVQRFGAREHEEHGAQDRQRDGRMRREQRDRVARRHRGRAPRARPRSRECRAPPASPNHSTMIGPNSPPTRAVPRRWIANSATRMPSVIGSTTLANVGIEQLEAFDGGEHRDRRRDQRVAVEQRRAECRERDERASPRRSPCRASAARARAATGFRLRRRCRRAGSARRTSA